MSYSTSTKKKWREVFERQQLANAERWLAILSEEKDPASVVVEEHDNLLRALELSLQKEETFDLAFRLIDLLFPIVIGYGDWDRWLVYLDNAILLSQDLRKASEEASLLSRKGEILIFKGKYQNGYELFNQSIQIYKRLGDDASYANTLIKYANAYGQHGKSEKGLKLLEEASKVSNANSKESQMVLMQVNLSLSGAYHQARKWELGLSSARVAYELAGILGNKRTEMQAMINIIAIQTELGNWEEVESLSSQIEESLTVAGDLIKLSQFKNNMGIAAFAQERYFVAEKEWQDAMQINLQIDQPIELARVYNNLGMAYTKLGEIDTAENMFSSAAELFKKMGDLYNWANTLDNLADIYEIQGDLVKFEETLSFALSLLPDDSHEAHVHSLISIINGRLAN